VVPNYFDVHFGDNPDCCLRVQAKIKAWKDGTCTWKEVSLNEHTKFQYFDEDNSETIEKLKGEILQNSPIENLHLKSRILNSLKNTGKVSHQLKELFQIYNAYHDVLYTSAQFSKSSNLVRKSYVIHALNHIFKYRDRVLKGSNRLKIADASDNSVCCFNGWFQIL
jgi:U3 small nucleolar RNA-associated protein 25